MSFYYEPGPWLAICPCQGVGWKEGKSRWQSLADQVGPGNAGLREPISVQWEPLTFNDTSGLLHWWAGQNSISVAPLSSSLPTSVPMPPRSFSHQGPPVLTQTHL